MPRPQRCRRINCFPDFWSFSPGEEENGTITMTLDELETIRLMDHEGQTHEECAHQMDVSRTTVTGIYESARRKVAKCLVEGKRLVIAGGKYRLSEENFAGNERFIRKGNDCMRVAVSYENGNIFQHFGHTEHFKLYDIEDGKITKEEIVDTNGEGHGMLAGFLRTAQANALICGGIGNGAQSALAEAGITLYAGVSGSADEAVKALVEGRLVFDSAPHCDHHEGYHGGHDDHEGHSCGHHGGHDNHEGHSCGHHGGHDDHEGHSCGHHGGHDGHEGHSCGHHGGHDDHEGHSCGHHGGHDAHEDHSCGHHGCGR
ncbi:MAG: DUF134 domain-containing protein [Fretibacterium sp.]|nr:DUF134 domain-containing protein [Fretibacterium sp.]